MIVSFTEAGFIVVADDHVGHGKTAVVNDSWGDWGDKGYETMVEDEYTLQQIAQDKFGDDLPYYMFGHSMGSVIARQFMAKYGENLDGVVLCGTCGDFPTAGLEEEYRKLVESGHGEEFDPQLLNQFMGWMTERCGDVTIGNEWICENRYVQVDHAEDPLDAFTKPVTNRAILYFIRMIDSVKGYDWAKEVPTALPIYSIGGDQDPFGGYGEGLYQTSNWLIDTGHYVKTKAYSGYRHEIHNYDDIKEDVEDGIIEFLYFDTL